MQAKPVRLGDLLTQAGVLRKEDLNEAIMIANDTGQLIGKVLIMSGYLSKHALQAAVAAQSLLRDHLIDFELATKAIHLSDEREIELSEALESLGWKEPSDASTAKLGELLLGAGVISSKQLESALTLAEDTGTPLGSVLISMKAITDQLLLYALDQQALVRDGELSKAEAIKLIAAAPAELKL